MERKWERKARFRDLESAADLGQYLLSLGLSFPKAKANGLHRHASSLWLAFPWDAFPCPVTLSPPRAARSPADTRHRSRTLGGARKATGVDVRQTLSSCGRPLDSPTRLGRSRAGIRGVLPGLAHAQLAPSSGPRRAAEEGEGWGSALAATLLHPRA